MGQLKNYFSTLIRFIKHHKKLSLVIGIILILLLVFVLRPKNGNAILTETAKRGEIVKSVSATGKIDADSKVDLTFLSSGKLVYLGVKKGDKVSAGQTIATLDQSTVDKNLKSALLSYNEQRNNFEQTLDNYNAKSANDVQNMTIKRILQNNQFDLEKAVNSVELQDLAKQNSILTTPIDGIVTRADVLVSGVNVGPTTTFSIVDPSSLSFSMEVDEADIGSVNEGQEVDVSLDAFSNENLTLNVSNIDLVSHTTSSGGNVFTVKAKLTSLGKYRVGLGGNAEIIVAKKEDVIVISSSCVTDDGYVYVKTGKKYQKTKVSTGIQNDTQVEIKSGISAGDVIASDPTSLPKGSTIN